MRKGDYPYGKALKERKSLLPKTETPKPGDYQITEIREFSKKKRGT